MRPTSPTTPPAASRRPYDLDAGEEEVAAWFHVLGREGAPDALERHVLEAVPPRTASSPRRAFMAILVALGLLGAGLGGAALAARDAGVEAERAAEVPPLPRALVVEDHCGPLFLDLETFRALDETSPETEDLLARDGAGR